MVDFHPVGQKQKLQSVLTHSVAGDVKRGLMRRHREAAEAAREEIDRISQRLNSDISLPSSEKREMKKEIERFENTEKAARETVARITSQSDSGSSLAHTALPPYHERSGAPPHSMSNHGKNQGRSDATIK